MKWLVTGDGLGKPPRLVTAVGAVLVLLLSGTLAQATTLASPQVATDHTEDSMIEPAATVLARQLDASNIPGGAVVVVENSQATARGVGTTGNQGNVGPDTPFVLGSTSKSFTALAVMQLVDSGAVDLEDPVTSYVPELDLAAGEPVDDITVRHLLQQTSGLSDLSAGPLVGSAAEGTPLAAVAELGGADLVSPPGQEWHYANINYVLAGLVIERASGMPYPDYIQRRIFDPLQMSHSYVTADAAQADGLSSGHRFWFGIPVASGPTRRTAMLAAGYLVSTPEDMGQYLHMYLSDGLGPDGTRIVSAVSLRTMFTPGPTAHLGPWAQGSTSHYAMGWFVGGPWDNDALFHPGNAPDSSSMISVFPDRSVAVATLLNAGHELPVPGNPSITDRVSRNVIHAALGQDSAQLPSLGRFYLVFDAVAIALLALALWGLVRAFTALSSARSLNQRSTRARSWAGIAIRTLGALALVLGASLLYGWAQLWTWAPDLALSITVLVLLWVATAAVRLLTLLQAQRRRRAHKHAYV